MQNKGFLFLFLAFLCCISGPIGAADNLKGSALPTATAVTGADTLIGIQGTTSKQFPISLVSPTIWAKDGTTANYTEGNVGIGTTTPSQKLEVSGTISSTAGGFKFPDGTTQTTAATGTVETPLWSTVTDGLENTDHTRVLINDGTPSVLTPAATALNTWSSSAITSGIAELQNNYIKVAPLSDSSATYRAFSGLVYSSGTANLTSSFGLRGLNLSVFHEGSGTATGAAGLLSVVGVNGTGTLTNGYGIYVQVNRTTGTLVNGYGLYMPAGANEASFTKSYGLYMIGGASHYLKGSLGVGIDIPTAKAHIVGTVAATPVVSVKGAASQSANLTEWQDSSATTLASVSATGVMSAPQYKETPQNLGTCATSTSVNTDYGRHYLALSGACSIGLNNLTNDESWTIEVNQTATTAPVWSSNYRWVSPPVMTTIGKYKVSCESAYDAGSALCGWVGPLVAAP